MITRPAVPGVIEKSRARRGSSESHTRKAAPLKNAAKDSNRTTRCGRGGCAASGLTRRSYRRVHQGTTASPRGRRTLGA